VVCFNATTLWHIDAVEWAPSTASLAATPVTVWRVRFTLDSGHENPGLASPLRAKNGHLDQATGHAKRHISDSPSPPDIRMRMVIITKI
jgi:hypothetical protein